MSEATPYDLIVIGGGPAGYAGAIRAGQMGKRVLCIELERAGGTCLNWGCIPTKALLKSAELYQKFSHPEIFGFTVKDVSFDFAKVMERSRTVAGQMAKGVEFLFRKNKVDYIIGRAQVEGEKKGQVLAAKAILIATGCKMRRLPGLEVDGVRVMTSREALASKVLPKSLAIIGAGAIGVEFAYFYRAFGVAVTLIEMLPEIVPVEDDEIARTLHRAFDKQGIAVHVGTTCENIRVGKDSVKLTLVKEGVRTELEAESLLSAVGVVANTEGLFGPRTKLEMDRNYIKVGADYQTSVKGIYAAGDIIGPPWLAHVATFEAVNAVNGIFGHGAPRRVKNYPGCTYCQPQIASVGLTEKAARAQGLAVKIGKFPFLASGKAVAAAESEGFVKLVTDAQTGEIYGGHVIGAEATELIAEIVLAMDLEATAEELHLSIHAHPTLGEAVMEAAAATFGEAIHI